MGLDNTAVPTVPSEHARLELSDTAVRAVSLGDTAMEPGDTAVRGLPAGYTGLEPGNPEVRMCAYELRSGWRELRQHTRWLRWHPQLWPLCGS